MMDPIGPLVVDWREYLSIIVKAETAIILAEFRGLEEARKAQHDENVRRLGEIERRLIALEANQRVMENTLGQNKGRDGVLIGLGGLFGAFIAASGVYFVRKLWGG